MQNHPCRWNCSVSNGQTQEGTKGRPVESGSSDSYDGRENLIKPNKICRWLRVAKADAVFLNLFTTQKSVRRAQQTTPAKMDSELIKLVNKLQDTFSNLGT